MKNQNIFMQIYWAFLSLELFIIKNCPKRPSYPEAYGLRHLAFAVDSVDEAVRDLNEKGIVTEPVRLDVYTGKKMTFFHDPDNLPLEIHEQAKDKFESETFKLFIA